MKRSSGSAGLPVALLHTAPAAAQIGVTLSTNAPHTTTMDLSADAFSARFGLNVGVALRSFGAAVKESGFGFHATNVLVATGNDDLTFTTHRNGELPRHSFSPLGGLRGSSIDVAAVDAPTLTISRPFEEAFATNTQLRAGARA